MSKKDVISVEILNILSSANEPLETKEIEEKLKEKIKTTGITRTKVFSRLNILWGKGNIKGKLVGSGKGVWIWWGADLFKK